MVQEWSRASVRLSTAGFTTGGRGRGSNLQTVAGDRACLLWPLVVSLGANDHRDQLFLRYEERYSCGSVEKCFRDRVVFNFQVV